MRYIEKDYNASAVLKHKQELIKCQLDKLSLASPDSEYVELTGTQLYKKVWGMPTFTILKQHLYEEQGGICCYCGAKLEYPVNSKSRVEHVKSKNTYRELVGEYENLLLSCDLTEDEYNEMSNSPKKRHKKYLHCDAAKGSNEIIYSPLNPDCQNAYIYGIDGSVTGADEVAKKDIKTLGLGCSYLKRRRSEAISAWFDDDISSEDLLRCKDAIMSRDKDNRLTEFCFVISNIIEQFLS